MLSIPLFSSQSADLTTKCSRNYLIMKIIELYPLDPWRASSRWKVNTKGSQINRLILTLETLLIKQILHRTDPEPFLCVSVKTLCDRYVYSQECKLWRLIDFKVIPSLNFVSVSVATCRLARLRLFLDWSTFSSVVLSCSRFRWLLVTGILLNENHCNAF